MHTVSVHATEDLLFSVLVQLIVMIGAARLLNTAFRRIGQPGAIGEIVAGLALGPSLLGHLFPDFSLALFGAKPSAPITILSQVGLILLMFQIGSDFEFALLRNGRNRRAVALVATGSIAIPFALGVTLGQLSAATLAPAIDRTIYSLFIGVGMAITAVPILGRILRQFDLTRTELGTIAISAAAINDVIGWLMLAVISALAASRFSAGGFAMQLGGLALFGAALWFVLRPAVDRLVARMPLTPEGDVPPNLMAVVLTFAFACGIVTYKIGIFAIFGGFAAGLLFHHHHAFVAAWRRQVGGFVMVFFLPVFFCFTGLRTNVLGLGAGDLGWLALILAASIGGKMAPVYLAGRAAGFDHNDAAILGTLMNTRALMELIVLNIGLDLGFLPQNVFTMLVVMAVVTTVMTGPLLRVLLRRAGRTVLREIEA